MKKLIFAVLLVTVLGTACGKSDKVKEATTESVEPAFTSTSYVTSATGEIVESEPKSEPDTTEKEFEIIVDTNFDFSTCEDAPVLGGEARELDWSIIFEENCVVLGDVKCPAYIKISDLANDIALEAISIGKESPDTPGLLNDYYTLYCHGYAACGIITARKLDDSPEDAYIYAWMLNGDREVPKEKLGIMGVSLMQTAGEVAEIYLPDEMEEDEVSYYGVTESDGKKFACIFRHDSDFMTMLTIIQEEHIPGIYDYYFGK